MSLTNVGSGSVDLGPLQVDASRRYCVDLRSDGPVAVGLTGLRFSGLDVTGVPATRSGGALILHVPAGMTHTVAAPRGTPAAVGTPCPAA